jgi:hypothetical protein
MANRSVSRHKYRAVRTEVDGIRFASKREARRFQELLLLERAGEITNLQLHPRYPIEITRLSNGEVTTIGHYTADFAYWDVWAKRQVIEDVKSGPTKTTAYRLRKRLVEAQYDFQITEVS